jgi:hypothetical protein
MHKYILPSIFLLLSINVFAQRSFEIHDASKLYDVTIQVATCNSSECSGKGIVKLYSKSSKKLLQPLLSENLNFFLDQNKGEPTANIVELYGEQSPVIFDDFNFDGSEDLAIRNGNESSYGGPSYDVYVYTITKKKFVISKELTELASTNLGMFTLNKKTKRIITFTKSGCCWHLTTEYKIIAGKGLLEVKSITEDATLDPKNYVTVTEKNLMNGVWKKTIKKHKVKDYYK